MEREARIKDLANLNDAEPAQEARESESQLGQ